MEKEPNNQQSPKEPESERAKAVSKDSVEELTIASPLGKQNRSDDNHLFSDELAIDSIEVNELSLSELGDDELKKDLIDTAQLSVVNELTLDRHHEQPVSRPARRTEEATLQPTKRVMGVEQLPSEDLLSKASTEASIIQDDYSSPAKIRQEEVTSVHGEVTAKEEIELIALEEEDTSDTPTVASARGDLVNTIIFSKEEFRQTGTNSSPNPLSDQSSDNDKKQEISSEHHSRLPTSNPHSSRKRFLIGLVIFLIVGGSIALIYGYDLFAQEVKKVVVQQHHLIFTAKDKKFQYDLQKAGYDGKNAKTIDQAQLRIWLDQVKKQIDQQPVNAMASKVDEPIQSEKEGQYMDTAKVEQWLNNIESYINKPTEIPVIKAYPTVTQQDIEQVKQKKVGSYTTRYDGSNLNRMTNIRLSSEAIDGLILMPGEQFSFNKVVGERTEGRGYKTASVIVKGEFSEGIGGGICQVSSTLFNSVDNAGLKIIRRFSHSATVTYVPSGRDATVSWGGPDFRFKNNFNKPIMVKIRVGKSSMTVNVYTASGAKVQRKVVQQAPQNFVEQKVDNPSKPTEDLSEQ